MGDSNDRENPGYAAAVASPVLPPEAPRRPGQLASAITTLSMLSRRLFKERLAAEPWVAEAGLRAPCYSVLTWIDRLEPVSQKRVSDQIAFDPSDIVTVVDILERGASSPGDATLTTGAATCSASRGRARCTASPRRNRARRARRAARSTRPRDRVSFERLMHVVIDHNTEATITAT